jgi:hypothetical protein
MNNKNKMYTLIKLHTWIKAKRNLQLRKDSNLTSNKRQSASIGRLCMGINVVYVVYFKGNVKYINRVGELQTDGQLW